MHLFEVAVLDDFAALVVFMVLDASDQFRSPAPVFRACCSHLPLVWQDLQ